MKAQFSKTLRVAGIGAACGGAFLVLIMVFGFDRPSLTGEKNIIGVCADWLGRPLGWFLEWALKRNLIVTDNVPAVLVLQFFYWMFFGAVVAMICFYLRR